MFPLHIPYIIETLHTRNSNPPIRPPRGSLRSSQRARSAQPTTLIKMIVDRK